MKGRFLFLLAAMVSAMTLLVVGPAQAQTASGGAGTSGGSGANPVPDQLPQQLEKRIAELKADGAEILGVTSAPYEETSKKGTVKEGTAKKGSSAAELKRLKYGSKSTSGTAEVGPAQYPTGCGLWVLVYRQGNLIYNDSLTSCLYQVLDIQMHSGLAWSRWWGWQELYEQTFDNDDSSSLDTYIWVDCSGTGTHDYQGVTNGFIETYDGREFHAAAYDQIDRIECG